jgi:hypothetical protein
MMNLVSGFLLAYGPPAPSGTELLSLTFAYCSP